MQEEIYKPLTKTKDEKYERSQKKKDVLVSITCKPTEKRRGTKSVQRFLLVITVGHIRQIFPVRRKNTWTDTPDELGYGQRALQAQGQESKNGYEDLGAAKYEEEDGLYKSVDRSGQIEGLLRAGKRTLDQQETRYAASRSAIARRNTVGMRRPGSRG